MPGDSSIASRPPVFEGRAGGICGLIATVLLLGSTFAVPLPPNIDAPHARIVHWIAAHREPILYQVWLQSFAALFSLGFALGLGKRLRAAGEEQLASLTVIASAVFLSVALLAQGPTGALAYSQVTDPVSVRMLWALANFTGAIVLQFPFAAFVFGPSLAIVKTGAMPRWIGWGGLVIGAYEFVGTTALVLHGDFAPGGFFSVSGYLLFAVWMLVVSILLVMRMRPSVLSPAVTSGT